MVQPLAQTAQLLLLQGMLQPPRKQEAHHQFRQTHLPFLFASCSLMVSSLRERCAPIRCGLPAFPFQKQPACCRSQHQTPRDIPVTVVLHAWVVAKHTQHVVLLGSGCAELSHAVHGLEATSVLCSSQPHTIVADEQFG